MKKLSLEEIEEITNAATKGPWNNINNYVETQELCSDPEWGKYSIVSNDDYDGGIYLAPLRSVDAEFIAMARTEIPMLIQKIKRLTEENK